MGYLEGKVRLITNLQRNQQNKSTENTTVARLPTARKVANERRKRGITNANLQEGHLQLGGRSNTDI